MTGRESGIKLGYFRMCWRLILGWFGNLAGLALSTQLLSPAPIKSRIMSVNCDNDDMGQVCSVFLMLG